MPTKPLEIRLILAKNLKEQRNRLGYSQERFAEVSGLSVQTVNDIEGGRKWVSDKTITKLSAALDIDCYELLIPGFTKENKAETTKDILALMKKLKKSVDSQIDDHFTDFLKPNALK